MVLSVLALGEGGAAGQEAVHGNRVWRGRLLLANVPGARFKGTIVFSSDVVPLF